MDGFSITTSAVGYLNSVAIEHKGEKKKMTAELSLLSGPGAKVKYVKASFSVVGEQAQTAISVASRAREDAGKVLVSLVADAVPDVMLNKGVNEAFLAGRLTFVKSVKADGDVIFQSK